MIYCYLSYFSFLRDTFFILYFFFSFFFFFYVVLLAVLYNLHFLLPIFVYLLYHDTLPGFLLLLHPLLSLLDGVHLILLPFLSSFPFSLFPVVFVILSVLVHPFLLALF